MYKITNTTKKEGHEIGPHKKGWFIGLEQNHIISPGGHAFTQELTPGLLDLRQQGLISIESLEAHQITPTTIPIPAIEKPVIAATKSTEAEVTPFATPVETEDAVYAGKTPNYIVTATPDKQGAPKPRAAIAAVKKPQKITDLGNFSG